MDALVQLLKQLDAEIAIARAEAKDAETAYQGNADERQEDKLKLIWQNSAQEYHALVAHRLQIATLAGPCAHFPACLMAPAVSIEQYALCSDFAVIAARGFLHGSL